MAVPTVHPAQLLSQEPLPLSQSVLLSLMQQLAPSWARWAPFCPATATNSMQEGGVESACVGTGLPLASS